MRRYPEDAWERAMKIQEVILRGMAKKITWWQAAEIIGISDRSMRGWCYEQYGYDGLLDRRRGGAVNGGWGPGKGDCRRNGGGRGSERCRRPIAFSANAPSPR